MLYCQRHFCTPWPDKIGRQPLQSHEICEIKTRILQRVFIMNKNHNFLINLLNQTSLLQNSVILIVNLSLVYMLWYSQLQKCMIK